MDLSQQLRTLPPEALEVIRYFSTLDSIIAHAGDITGETGLSERAFGRAIRRLVTRGYLIMDGNQRYRLTELGQRAVDTFVATDDGTDWAAEVADSQEDVDWTPKPVETQLVNIDWSNDPADPVDEPLDEAEEIPDAPEAPAARTATRRMIVALPRALVAGQPETVYVGFAEAADKSLWSTPADLLVRLSVLNGEPARAQEWALQLQGDNARQSFEITAGQYAQARLRLSVFQLRDGGEDVDKAGGMYVDLEVLTDDAEPAEMTAYGTDVAVSLSA